MACSVSFLVLQAATSENVLTCKFTMNKLHVDFIIKDCQRHYKLGQVGQVLQIGAGITKWNNFF